MRDNQTRLRLECEHESAGVPVKSISLAVVICNDRGSLPLGAGMALIMC